MKRQDRFRVALGAVVCTLLTPSGLSQEHLELELVSELSAFEWIGNTTAGGLADPDLDPSYAWIGTLELEITPAPVGVLARFDGGQIRWDPPIRAELITALAGQVEYVNATLRAESPPFDLVPFSPFQTDLTLTFTGGTVNINPPAGPALSVPLAGRILGTLQVSGASGITVLRDFQLNVNLFAFDLDFEVPGWQGTIRSTGRLQAEVTCSAPTNFCTAGTNSTDAGAVIVASGLPSVGAGDLTLGAFFLPGARPGRFSYGRGAVQAPFGDGFRSVAGPCAPAG